MNNLTVNIPLQKKELESAERLASMWGFDSFEEAVKTWVKNLIKNPPATPEEVVLSAKAKIRYEKMDEEFNTGKNITVVNDVKKLYDHLKI